MSHRTFRVRSNKLGALVIVSFIVLTLGGSPALASSQTPSGHGHGHTTSTPPATATSTPTTASTNTSTPTAASTPTRTPTPAPTSTLTATPTATSTGGAVSIVGLHVQGNQVVNASNQVVYLRGADRSGTEYMCLYGSVFDGPSDQTSVTAMRSWKINIVRLPVNEDCWLGINGQPSGLSSATYRSAIVNYVNLLDANGMAAIIDLQWAAPGTSVSNGLIPMPDADHAPAFWSSVAGTFQGNQSVIFDLFNEPYPDNNADTTAAWTCLRNGGTCSGVAYSAAGTQSLVNAIRAAGATNIIMVPGVQYTNSMTQWLTYEPTDPRNNLVASWHSYAGQVCSSTSCFDTYVAPVTARVPLIAGEIGENDCQHTYIDTVMSWLDAHQAGYLGWAWNTYDCSSFPALISNFDGTPTNFGVGLRDHLQAVMP